MIKYYLNGLIRDQNGRKMSKSANNGVDPMDIIDKYGLDALRWFLLTNTSPGMDIRFSTEKIESAWRINNKLWNIAKFIKDILKNKILLKTDYDKWILTKLANLNSIISKMLEKYEFAVVGTEIYKFYLMI
ncbi:class I tRNA ligase family protein [Mycoplasmopsis cynos]|nr:class I tRNA ligase family protein [Mycoplasmopsis cynos]